MWFVYYMSCIEGVLRDFLYNCCFLRRMVQPWRRWSICWQPRLWCLWQKVTRWSCVTLGMLWIWHSVHWNCSWHVTLQTLTCPWLWSCSTPRTNSGYWARRAICSRRNQSYQHYKKCIALWRSRRRRRPVSSFWWKRLFWQKFWECKKLSLDRIAWMIQNFLKDCVGQKKTTLLRTESIVWPISWNQFWCRWKPKVAVSHMGIRKWSVFPTIQVRPWKDFSGKIVRRCKQLWWKCDVRLSMLWVLCNMIVQRSLVTSLVSHCRWSHWPNSNGDKVVWMEARYNFKIEVKMFEGSFLFVLFNFCFVFN